MVSLRAERNMYYKENITNQNTSINKKYQQNENGLYHEGGEILCLAVKK